MIKYLFLIILIIPLFMSCGNEHDKKEKYDTPERVNKDRAVGYVKKVQSLSIDPSMSRDTINLAISLLDSAILLDSANVRALVLKQSYQTWLGEYEETLKTIKALEKVKPHNPEIISKKGLLYLFKGKKRAAREAFIRSERLWNKQLDTLSLKEDWILLGALLGKLANLKLLGKEDSVRRIYHRILKDTLFDKPKYNGLRESIDSIFIEQSKEEFYNHLRSGFGAFTHFNP